ncbi:hypothetical protein RclHR1_00590006 [Rhizophagus clarus]|uniref:Protein kinase domain-containing protein n=1 Tax=Rhizophagus clarus TaxID=94130 RepID=A0A2Z6S6J8_9GLOM|nr:hypothetical protein RclHR1_00590006 [Rhizophagus clarus]
MSRLGKSDSEVVNKFISRNKLRWIPYDKFENVRYFDEGGFGIIYRAGWLYKNGNREVVLKCFNRLNNLHNDLDKFLNEWKYRGKCFKSLGVIDLYGFTKDPNTSKYMLVVIEYANKEKGEVVYISDLGLCQPIKTKNNDIFGVIPFMAPEILRGNPYTPASDIYSFSMIMWEFTSGVPPFYDRAHDFELSLSICEEIRSTIKNWIFRYEEEDDDDDYIIDEEELKRDIEEFINTPQIIRNNLPTEPHPQASYTSRSHNFTSKSLNEILESKRSHVIIVDEIEEEECFDDLMIWQYKLIRCVIYNFL